jgi:SagB-type dehydrogenase family enzyme
VHGQRIEVEEIEAMLRDHADVKQAAVTVAGDGTHRHLVAYVENSPAATDLAAPAGVAERVAFKLSEPGLRESRSGEREITLVDGTRPTSWYLERRSYRRFAPGDLRAESLGQWLATLRAIDVDGAPVPKYRYASGGGLYAVRVYVALRMGAIDGWPAGVYYYHPRRHALVQVGGEDLGELGHEAINRETGRQARLTLFLVAVRDVVEALYGDAWREFCLIEAGGIAHLLMTEGPALGIGACPIGRLGVEPVRERLGLNAGEELIHTLVAGPIRPAQQTAQGWVEELTAAARALESPRDVEQRLKAYLRERLPEYLVPAAIIPVERLPLTANGKLDRKRLGELRPTVPVDERPITAAPQSDLERRIADIWCKVLGVAEVAVTDTFFDLGGNSLHIVIVHRELRDSLGCDVSIVDLFRCPTVREIADLIQGVRTLGVSAADIAMRARQQAHILEEQARCGLR